MTTLEALRIARDRIAKGWIQGKSYRAVPEGWCSTGALIGSHGGPFRGCVGCVAEDLIAEVVDDVDVSGWNDAPGRTQAEVLAVFDRAIALAEAMP